MKKPKTGRRARRVLDKPPVLGWKTSDEDELNLRRWRGRTEIAAIEALEPEHGPFGTFRVRSSAGGVYEVEIRDLEGRDNSCGCIDHRVNGLGTCKHIEGVLGALKRTIGARAFNSAAVKRSPRVEIFLRRQGQPSPVVLLLKFNADANARAFLAPFCSRDDTLNAGPADIKALLGAAP
ncbi:MAG: hypothetical protein ACREH9_06700, partial [Pseudomonadota bacterium]